jgi:hypothetical protein
MKKLTILLFCLLLSSCFDRNIELTKKESVVVDIKQGNGSLAFPHKIKVYYNIFHLHEMIFKIKE